MSHAKHPEGCCINQHFYRYDGNSHDPNAHHFQPNTFRAQGADVLIKAKHIITLNPEQPEVTAVVIRGGHIVAVGDEAGLRDWLNEQTLVLDYGDCTVVPGFIEAHSHPLLLGIGLKHLDLTINAAPTRAQVLAAMAQWLKDHPERLWLIAWGYDPSVLDDTTPLSREELDAICPDKPVFVANDSLHIAYVNSKAFALAHIDNNTPDPFGGHYVHTATGELQGEVQEMAALLPLLQAIPPLDFEQLTQAAYLAAGMFREQGYTTIVDAGLGLAAHNADLACYRSVVHNQDFPVRVIVCPMGDLYDPGVAWTDIGDTHLKLGAFKFVIDGSVQGYTAYLSSDFLNKPGVRGQLTVDKTTFQQQILKAHKADNQVFIHANGDAAIDVALDAIALAQAAHPRNDHRHRIEHSQLATQAQLARMKSLGVYPNFFVSHVYYWGDVHVKSILGPERAAHIDPLGWAIAQELRFTLHSDAPVTLPNAVKTLWIATNRKTRSGQVLGKDQRVTPLIALKAMTLDAAFTLREDHRLGSIEVGKLADFTVLDQNPLTYPLADLQQINVVTTILGGIDTRSVLHSPS